MIPKLSSVYVLSREYRVLGLKHFQHKPLFSSKSGNVSQKITLVENESIISCESQIAECFNQYFVNITDSLPIEPYVTLPSYVPL